MIDRYSRQTLFRGIGEEGQRRLGSSRIVIIGCGAPGAIIATSLVRAGVGRVRIIDGDFIEYHNLQRQVIFDEEDIKAQLPKAIAAERHLKRVNSSVEIEGIVADVNHTNIERFISDADLILDGLIHGLSSIPGLNLYVAKDRSKQAPVISCNLRGYEPGEVGAILDQAFDIKVRTGLHCAPAAHRTLGTYPLGTIRLSPGYFNTVEEIELTLQALKKIATKTTRKVSDSVEKSEMGRVISR